MFNWIIESIIPAPQLPAHQNTPEKIEKSLQQQNFGEPKVQLQKQNNSN